MKVTSTEMEQALQAGRQNELLSYLYGDTLEKVVRYVMKNSGSEDDGKDVFQDVVLALFNKVVRGDQSFIDNVGAYVFTMSRNRWIDRQRKARPHVDINQVKEGQLETDEGDESSEQEERKSLLRESFKLLGEKCQKLLLYAIYQKMPMTQIALELKLANANAAKMQHYRCKKQLAEIVKNKPR